MAAPLVEIEGVEVRLGGRPVLSGVSLALREGECWALQPNGSGKSTLLRVLRGEIWPHHQVILVTHHRDDLVPAIGHVLELSRGRAVYQGPRSAWSSPNP